MNTQEAADLALAIRGLFFLACLGVATSTIGWMLFGTVNPRLRRAFRRIKARDQVIVGLKREQASLTDQNAAMTRTALANEQAIFDAQQQVASLELEVRRQRRIREKTEDRLKKQNDELEELRKVR